MHEHALACQELAATALLLARRAAAGGRMWCAAPAWPSHAHHLAVEFVHPVIVGKRALPAVAVEAAAAAEVLRASVRPGDVLVAVGTAADPTVADLVQRSPAWGLDTVWIGFGDRPPAGSADHLLWIDEDDPLLPYTGQLVLRYHVLWELTHVCFEHPGLLQPADDADTGDVCITCSDEGRVAEIVTVGDGGDAQARSADGVCQIDVSLVGEVEPGDLVLIHAGTAIARAGDQRGS